MLSQNKNKTVIYSVGDIETLINQAKEGDNDSFAKLYEEFLTPLYRYVLSRCGDVNLAEDICQSTFLRFYEALYRYQNDKSPLAYLFTIARNLLINEYKKFKPEYIDDETFSHIEDSSNFLEELDIKLTYEQITNFIKELSNNEQDVLNLIYLSELNTKEVASILNQKEDWVRQIKHRALKKLQIKVLPAQVDQKFYDK